MLVMPQGGGGGSSNYALITDRVLSEIGVYRVSSEAELTSAIAANPDIILLVGHVDLTGESAGDWEIPSGSVLTSIGPGAYISTDATHTVTFAEGSKFHNSRWQIFNCSAANQVIFAAGSADCIYAEAFGAVGDDSTDNADVLAILFDIAVRYGIPILFGVGVFVSATTVTITDLHPTTTSFVHIRIHGAGCPDNLADGNPDVEDIGGTTIKFTNDDGTDGIVFQPTLVSTAVLPSFEMRNIKILGSGASSGDGVCLIGDDAITTIRNDFTNVSIEHFGGGVGLYLYFCMQGSYRNVSCNYNSTGISLLSASNASVFENVIVQKNKEYGIYVNDCTTDSFIGGLVQSNDKTGVCLNGADEFVFIGTHFELNNSTSTAGKYALHLLGESGKPNGFNTFIGCRFAYNADKIYLEGVSGGATAYTHFYNCRSYVSSGYSLTIKDAWVMYTRIIGTLGGTISDSGYLSEVTNPAWVAWTPNLTSGSADLSGYDTARYIVINKTVHFVFVADSKNLSGSAGTIQFSLPVAVGSSAGITVFNTDVNNGSTWVGKVHCNVGASATVVNVFKSAAADTWNGSETGVSIRVSGTYEIS